MFPYLPDQSGYHKRRKTPKSSKLAALLEHNYHLIRTGQILLSNQVPMRCRTLAQRQTKDQWALASVPQWARLLTAIQHGTLPA